MAEHVVEKIARLNEIGIALSSDRDPDSVCDRILKGAMELTSADGGSLYRMSDDHTELSFVIVATHSLDIYMGGASEKVINFPPVPLYKDGAANKSNVVCCAVHDDCTINIDDAYHAEGFDFSGTRKFDESTGYRTMSILTIPMKNHQGDIIGVLQLINAKDEASGATRPFTNQDQQLAESLASQAAISMTTNKLIEEQRELFEAFIELMASAIDEKSPYTGGHCKRVPELTMMIAEACHDCNDGPLAAFRMEEKDRYELQIAGWLHDCGKVTTPEYVVDKATKLETIYDRVNTVDARFEILKRDATIAMLQQKIAVLQNGQSQAVDFTELEKQCEAKLAQLDNDRDFVRTSNVGGEFMEQADKQRIEDIAQHQFVDPTGLQVNLLNDDEIKNLTIERGTLTHEEREIINNHIVVTIKMLEELPFPKHLTNVPEYAGGHHERMDGKGYPKGLKRDEMSWQARMMGIADIFEALSASDRPYKTGKPLTECLRILGFMKKDHHVDPDIFDVFVRDRVYMRYAEAFLPKEQIDEVNHADIPGYDGG